MRVRDPPERLWLPMEIFFLSGKGGVGKSVVAAAMAKNLAESGKKVLLIELGEQSYFRHLFEIKEVFHQPTVVSGWCSVALWSGKSCFRDYAKHLLKVDSLYRLIFENPVAASLVDAAPGLSELSILGKVTSGPPRNVGPVLDFDALVVDCYSSGHFLALMKAPFAFAEIISMGPMGEQTRGIIEVLKSPKTSFFIVTQSEEMMVTESIELYRNLQTVFDCQPQFILNKVLERPKGAPPDDLFGLELSRFFDRQIGAEESLRKISKTQLAPWIFSQNPRVVAEGLALRNLR